MTYEQLQLSNITTGTEITIIKDSEVSGVLYVVGEYSEKHQQWRYRLPNSNKDCGLIPVDGKGYYSFHKRDIPHYYFSANPVHVEKAKQKIKMNIEQKTISVAQIIDQALLHVWYYDFWMSGAGNPDNMSQENREKYAFPFLDSANTLIQFLYQNVGLSGPLVKFHNLNIPKYWIPYIEERMDKFEHPEK